MLNFFTREVIEMFSQWNNKGVIKPSSTTKTFVNHSLKFNLLKGRA